MKPNGANTSESSAMRADLRVAPLATAPARALGVIGGMTAAGVMAVAELSDFTGYGGGGELAEPVLGTARIPAAITTVAMDLCGEKVIAGPPSASPDSANWESVPPPHQRRARLAKVALRKSVPKRYRASVVRRFDFGELLLGFLRWNRRGHVRLRRARLTAGRTAALAAADPGRTQARARARGRGVRRRRFMR